MYFSGHIEMYVPSLLKKIYKDVEDSWEHLNSLRLQKVPKIFYKEEQVTLTTYKTLKNWRISEEKKKWKNVLPHDVIKF